MDYLEYLLSININYIIKINGIIFTIILIIIKININVYILIINIIKYISLLILIIIY